MVVSTLRPLLLVLAGAAVGSLLTFGLLNRHQTPRNDDSVQAAHAPEMLRAPSPKAKGDDKPDDTPGLAAETQDTSDSEEALNPAVQARLEAAKKHVPVRPLPTPKMVLQENGLPVGVTPDAGVGNPEVYSRLPGVQQPLINRDGRDMSQEALQMLATHQTETQFPGGLPSDSATPMPFPQSVDEANHQSQGYVSPSATP
jgi:hypothetical protein